MTELTSERQVLPVATGRATAGELFRALARHPGQLALTVGFNVLTSVGTVALPLVLGRLVDQASEGAGVAPLIVALAALMLVTVALGGAAQRSLARLAAQVGADLRELVVVRALELDTATLERAGHGDIASRVTDDAEMFIDAIPLFSQVISALITLVIAIVGFVALDWRIALAFAAVIPVYVIALRWFLPRATVQYAAERRLSADRSSVVLSSLRGSATVTAYQMADLQSGRVRTASAAALAASRSLVNLVVRFGVAMNIAEAIGLSAVIATGFFLVRADVVTVGAVTAAALLFHRLFGPLGLLLMSFDDMQRAGSALARMVGVIQIPQADELELRPRSGPVRIRARGISHCYVGDHQVLDQIDLDIPAGTSLALVGASGAGKTTLAGIIGGAIPPTAGQVELVDSAGAVASAAPGITGPPAQLRTWVRIVSQETYVFSGTVRDEFSLAQPEITDAEIWAALDQTGASGWVRGLSDGLDTQVGPSTSVLSAAQTQHLALARLVACDPAVVVLDEATAEAGSAGATALETAGRAAMAGRTALIVAHRLSQARACDQIVVLEAGRIVEQGNHDELVAAGGPYANLWASYSRH